jgi:hypothetical protein
VASPDAQASEQTHQYEGWVDGDRHVEVTLNCSPGYIAATENDLRGTIFDTPRYNANAQRWLVQFSATHSATWHHLFSSLATSAEIRIENEKSDRAYFYVWAYCTSVKGDAWVIAGHPDGF